MQQADIIKLKRLLGEYRAHIQVEFNWPPSLDEMDRAACFEHIDDLIYYINIDLRENQP
jgi:hypothetical protein